MQLLKKKKRNMAIKCIIGQMDLTDIHRIAQIYLSAAHRMFTEGNPKQITTDIAKLK